MAKRLKQAVYGIRPHVVHMWEDESIEAIEMQHRRLLNPDVSPDFQQLSEEERALLLDLVIFRAGIDIDFCAGLCAAYYAWRSKRGTRATEAVSCGQP